MRGIDATLFPINGGLYDIGIQFDGDIETKDSFDTFILVALLTDARADASEMGPSHRRRGWIGNEHTPGFEIGSKLWLYEQARLTRTVMNEIETETVRALQSLVDDDLADAILGADLLVTTSGINLTIEIQRDPSEVEKRHFDLWNNTGFVSSPALSPSATAAPNPNLQLFSILHPPSPALYMRTPFVQNAAVGITDTYTLAVWAKNSVVSPSGVDTIVTIRQAGNANSIEIACVSGSNDDLFVLIRDATQATRQEHTWANVVDGNTDTWHQYVLTWDGTVGGLRMYIDGVDTSPTTSPFDLDGTGITDNFRGYRVGQNWTGPIYSVALWDSALTASEAAAIYNGGNARDFGDLNKNSGAYVSSSSLINYFRPGLSGDNDTDFGLDQADGAPLPGKSLLADSSGPLDRTILTTDIPV